MNNRLTLQYVQIPTLVAYEDGDAVAFGAQALEYTGAENVHIAKWFKVS